MLPDGCFYCCCRPFFVRRLDWPNGEAVGLFREIQGLVPNRLVLVDHMGLLSSSSGTARVLPTALSSLLLEVQKAVVAVSSLVLRVRISRVLLHLTKPW